jgi:hypothetical protein
MAGLIVFKPGMRPKLISNAPIISIAASCEQKVKTNCRMRENRRRSAADRATGTIMAPEMELALLAIFEWQKQSKDNITHTTADLNCADIDLSST